MVLKRKELLWEVKYNRIHQGFADYLDLDTESALSVDRERVALQIPIERMLGRTMLPPEFSLCHLILVVWDKGSSQLTSETESLLKTIQDPNHYVLTFFKTFGGSNLSSLKKYVHKNIYLTSNWSHSCLLVLWTMNNFISRAFMHIFTFKNSLLLCAYFFNYKKVFIIVFFFCWN